LTSDERPDPDQLLARVAADEARQARGRLKLFFGAAPGVGKTYAMLEAGRKQAKEGHDVVVGYVEPHVRPETQALVLGLDMLPVRFINYRSAKLPEFDLEAALARKPELILVDELAHTNAPGMLRAKRWQDVEALREAGIDVYTTLNVQHLESLNDVVAQITGIVVRETIPDFVFDDATEIELVDIAPDDLIERLREGKVYLPQQAARAIDHFFQKGNLIALRELALRRTAERVDAQMTAFRREHAIERTVPASERLLVCVSASPMSGKLVRATRRMAASLHAPWTALHVETPADIGQSSADAERLAQTLNLAEQLGAQTATCSGSDLPEEVLQYARQHNVTRIIVGKPNQPRWKELIGRSYVYELTRRSGDIDIYVISGDTGPRVRRAPRIGPQRARTLHYLGAVGVVVLCTGFGHLMFRLFPRIAPENLVMAYLLGVVVVSAWGARGEAILAAVLSVAAYDFFFVPPYNTFVVSDAQYAFTFAVMLLTGLVISTLTTRVKFQVRSARQREQRTAALYAMSRELVEVTSPQEIVNAAAKHLRETFQSEIFLLVPPEVPEPVFNLHVLHAEGAPVTLEDSELAVARWVFEHGEPAGRGTDTLPAGRSLFLPLRTQKKTVGILALRAYDLGWQVLSPEQMRLLETFAGQLALTTERVRAAQAAQQARLQVETERLRHALYSGVSHDLRTPLAVIMGASSALLDNEAELDSGSRAELARSIFHESERLSRLVTNLLEMTRLEAGGISARKDWQPIEEVIGAALHHLSRPLEDRPVTTRLAPGLPLVPIDPLLIEQVLVNLLENAIKHTPAGSPIEISASLANDSVTVEVADRGPGVPEPELERIFEKFHQAQSGVAPTGVGLGLALCRAIVELHRGTISAANRAGGGMTFRFTLPLEGTPPGIVASRG
jgi:two-component system sensor histidine kinase KdpD